MGDGEDFVHPREMFPILTNAPPSQIRREKIEHKVRRYHLCFTQQLRSEQWEQIASTSLGDRSRTLNLEIELVNTDIFARRVIKRTWEET